MIELGEDDLAHRSEQQAATLAMLRARFANAPGYNLHDTADGGFIVTSCHAKRCASIEELAAFGRQLGIA